MPNFALNRNQLQNLPVRQYCCRVRIDVPFTATDYYIAQSSATYWYRNTKFRPTFSIIHSGKQQLLLFAAWDEKLSGIVNVRAATLKRARASIKLSAIWCNEKSTRHGDLECIICLLLFKYVCESCHFVSVI